MNKRNVLILDDSQMMGTLLSDFLEFEGYGVVGPATTLGMGHALATEHSIDAAIVDYLLREETSVQLIWELFTRGIPAIVYSGMRRVEPTEFPPNTILISKGPSVRELISNLKKICPVNNEA